MRSPRTEAPDAETQPARRHLGSALRRLDVRLAFAIASVALVGLLVSGMAISQILPGFFEEQTRDRLRSAIASTKLVIEVLADFERRNSGILETPELRDFVLQRAADVTAESLIPATVEMYNVEGQRVAHAEPPDTDALLAQGLRPDPQVGPVRDEFGLRITGDEVIPYTLVIRDAWTSRERTVGQVRGALLGTGAAALVVSLVVGLLVARRLTVPISRLRGAASRLGQGELSVRAAPSGIEEIDELAAQFNLMADRLSDSLRMLAADRDRLREFVADVSHELRTPIAALRMYTDLQRDGQVDEPTRNEFLDRSTEQLARLEWLSTNLLDLSRIEAGILPLDMRDGDLRDPVRATVEAHAGEADARGVALTSAVPARPVMLRFDRERMVQLLNNLVGNALKFTQRGGTVSVRLSEAADEVTMEVVDTGAGIPPEELPRIFERFYRGTNTGEARASGSGLGLAISRSIVEMHGGTIEVRSVVGEGSIFRVGLPRAGGPASAVRETAAQRQ
ncbi:MAG TPA: HAMP domain-containing sensor histidine kinase [Candidatus Limnocylindria bacterium]|nr:HAMP domain-containing sensor histidine kinase [Candidatus Limnocylindria bacterium]